MQSAEQSWSLGLFFTDERWTFVLLTLWIIMEHNSSNPWIFLDGYFWNYPSSLSWTLNSKTECPERRYIFPKFNPCTPVSRIFDSAIISLNHVACYIGKCFNVLTHPPPVIIHLSYDGFFCSYKCELAATPFVPLLHTTHCRGDLLPTHGGGLSWDDN